MQAKWKRRTKKIEKRKRGMKVSGRSVFTIQAIQKKKAETLKTSGSVKRKRKP